MNDKKQAVSVNQAKEGRGFDFGAAIAIGMTMGLVFGTALGSAGLGLTIGLLLATLANAYHDKKQGKKGANIALAIITGAVILIIALWTVTVGWS